LKVLIVLALLCGLGAGGWWYYHSSPAYALSEIQSAAKSHNRLKFQRYVDLDALSQTMVDAVVGSAMSKAADETTGFGALGAALGASMMQNLKPALVAQLRSAILEAVDAGRMDQVVSRRDTARVGLAFLSTAAAATPNGFLGVSDLQREGSIASFALRFRDRQLDTTLALRVRMDKQAGGWRVTSFDDLPGYLKSVDMLQRAQLSRINDQQVAIIKRHVRLGALRRQVDEVGYSTYLKFFLTFDNIGRDTIRMVAARLQHVRGLDPTDKDAWLLLDGSVAPGTSGTMRTIYRYNEFIEWHSALRYGTGIVPEVFLLAVADDTISLYENWASYVAEQGR